MKTTEIEELLHQTAEKIREGVSAQADMWRQIPYWTLESEEWSKPVLALFRNDGGRKLSAMVDGSPHTKTAYYKTLADAEMAISEFIQSLQ